MEKRRFGSTDFHATIMGLGGEGVLRTYGYDKPAYDLINRAIDLGINYFDSARAYSGSENYYGAALKERRKEIFLTSKSHDRTKSGSLGFLSDTLANMKTDYLDLWQVHDVRTDFDLAEIFGSNGAIEAFQKAKKDGKVKYIGITAHEDPAIILKALDLYEFDSLLIPVNPAEGAYKPFNLEVIKKARSKNMAIIAMKVFLKGMPQKLPNFTGFDPYFRFALSHDVDLAVIGCDTVEQLEENVKIAENFTKMTPQEMSEFTVQHTMVGKNLMYYKS